MQKNEERDKQERERDPMKKETGDANNEMNKGKWRRNAKQG